MATTAITRGYLRWRAALALAILAASGCIAFAVTLSARSEIDRHAIVAQAIDQSQNALHAFMLAARAVDGEDQRREAALGELRRAAQRLDAAREVVRDARDGGFLSAETQSLIANPTLDLPAALDEISEIAALIIAMDPISDRLRHAIHALEVLIERASPVLLRIRAAEDAARRDLLDRVEWIAWAAFAVMLLGLLVTALVVNGPMIRRILAAQQEAEAGRRAAQEASAAKTAFLANMSHEIRTPMNGVIGMASLLRDTQLDDRQRAMLDTINKSGGALVELINGVLDLAKIEAGHMQIESAPVELDVLLHSVRDLFEGRALEKGIDLRLDIEPGALGWRRMGDAGAIRQIASNLVSNAVKFTDEGAVTLRLREGADEAGGPTVVLSVRDDGPGIPEEARGRIFERFEQVDSTMARRHGGTGLGLALVKSLSGTMNGRVELASAVGEGTTFTVTLPAPVADPDETVAAPDPTPDATAQARGPLAPGQRVLVAEDNEVNQMVIRALLERVGCDVRIAENGEEAADLAAETAPALILMDISMPVLDGFEATRRIRAAEAESGRARAPIVGLSANAMSEHRAAARAAGMDGYLTKPIDFAKLDGVLATYLLTLDAEISSEDRKCAS